MPEHASSRHFGAALFDQQSEEHKVADWGGDDLFTRMPRPRMVDDAPPPRFRPEQLEDEPAPSRTLTLVEPPEDRRADPLGGRPERIMAWAFALGLLLILIAITTADAAPL